VFFLSLEEESKRILAKWGKSFREEIKELLKKNPKLVDEACEIFEKEYLGNTFVNSLRVIDGTNEMLLLLKNKYTLAVATGNQHKMLKERIFTHFHIPDVFSQIISSHEIADQEKTKPHLYMLETIMSKQHVLPEETVYIGDAKTDVQMAYSAHVTSIVVLSGHLTRQEAEKLRVKHILDNVTLIENELSEL
jgi:phosphoglycolate phosphatase-like HAD superfamily hydrolase